MTDKVRSAAEAAGGAVVKGGREVGRRFRGAVDALRDRGGDAGK